MKTQQPLDGLEPATIRLGSGPFRQIPNSRIPKKYRPTQYL